MNGNELANSFEKAKSISEVARLVVEEAIPMLRQLQTENEALKKSLEMKIYYNNLANKALNIKLTDKEILALWDWDSGEILATDLLDFAGAILRASRGEK